LLTSRWRSPASSSSRARRALWWRPRRHCRAPRRLRDARRPFYRPPGGGRFPGACSSTASAALGEGAQAPTSQGGLPPRRFLPLLPLPTTSTPRSPGERAPAAHAANIPRPAVPGAPAAGSFAPSCVPPALAPAAAPRARGLGAWAGRTARRSWPPYARKSEMSEL
jgi:hypothetical protein